MQNRSTQMFLVQKAKIFEKKQRFLSLIETIAGRTRQQRQGIVEIKNQFINQQRIITEEEQKTQRRFYAVMRQKNQLQVQSKVKMQELKSKRAANINITHKELQKNIAMQKALNKSRAQGSKAQVNIQLREKLQKKYL